MLRKVTNIILFALIFFVLAGTTQALPAEPYEQPFLPYYWVMGEVTDADGFPIYSDPNDPVLVYFYYEDIDQRIEVAVGEDSRYMVNAYELKYFYGLSVDYSQKLAIPQDSLGYGAEEGVYLPKLSQGFVIKNLQLCEGCGPVFGSFMGNVYEEDGVTGIEAARVEVAGAENRLYSASDDTGSYYIENVPIGSHDLLARKDGFIPLGKTGFLSETDPLNFIDFNLLAVPGKAVLYGYVKNQSDEALIGATILIHGQSLAITQDRGFYSIATQPMLAVAVEATFAGYEQSEPITIDLIADIALRQDITMQPVEAFNGQITGNVKDANEVIIQEAIRVSAANLETFANDSGEYELTNVPAGTHRVSALADGYKPGHYDDVVVNNGSVVSGIDIRLEPLDPWTAALFVKVLDKQNDSQIENAVVDLYEGEDIIMSRSTSAYGECDFIDISPGTYNVKVHKEDFAVENIGLTLQAEEVRTLVVKLDSGPPEGTVSLNVARGEGVDKDNVLITWDNNVYPDPRIFVWTGDGSGQYRGGAAGLEKIVDSGVLTTDLPSEFMDSFQLREPGTLVFLNQVGKSVVEGGIPAAYFRGLVADPNDDRQNLGLAPEVGKFDITSYKGDNLISLPLIPDDMKRDKVFGDQLTDAVLFSYVGDVYSRAILTSGAWSGPLSYIEPDKGYILRIDEDEKIITFVGAVAPTTRVIELQGDRNQNLIGPCYPGQVDLMASGLNELSSADVIWKWDTSDPNNSHYVKATNDGGNRWGGPLNQEGFKPGHAYWIMKNSSGNMTWRYSSQIR